MQHFRTKLPYQKPMLRQIEWGVQRCFLIYFFFKKAKSSGQQLILNTFWWTSTWTYNKNKFITIQTVDAKICSILISHKCLGLAPHTHFLSDLQEKYCSCYILLTARISLSGWVYLMRHWTICVFQLFVVHPVTS